MLDFNATQRNDGAVNAIDPDFEIPSQYRWNLGVKHTLPFDIEMTADFIYSRVHDEVLWQDIRLQQIGTAPDGRPIYGPRPDGRTNSSIQDFLLTNTHEGESTVYSIDASKTWRTGAGRFDAYLGYAHQDVKDVNPGHEFDGVLELGQRRRIRPEQPARFNLELRDRTSLRRHVRVDPRRSSATPRRALACSASSARAGRTATPSAAARRRPYGATRARLRASASSFTCRTAT